LPSVATSARCSANWLGVTRDGNGTGRCIAGAIRTGGSPVFFMPLVFGFAPVVNVIVASILHKPDKAPNPLLYVGILLLGAGAWMVLRYKP